MASWTSVIRLEWVNKLKWFTYLVILCPLVPSPSPTQIPQPIRYNYKYDNIQRLIVDTHLERWAVSPWKPRRSPTGRDKCRRRCPLEPHRGSRGPPARRRPSERTWPMAATRRRWHATWLRAEDRRGLDIPVCTYNINNYCVYYIRIIIFIRTLI